MHVKLDRIVLAGRGADGRAGVQNSVVNEIDLAGSDNMRGVRGLKLELSLDDIVDLKHIVPVPGNGLVRIAVKPGGTA